MARANCWKQLVRDPRGQRLALHIQTGSDQNFELFRGEPASIHPDGFSLSSVALAFSGNRWPEREEDLAPYFYLKTYLDPDSNAVIQWYVKKPVRHPLKGTVVRDLLRDREGVFLIKGGPQGSRLLYDSVKSATDDEITFQGRFTLLARDLAEFVIVPQRTPTRRGVIERE